MNLNPLLVIIIPVILTLSVASIYRSVYPYERIQWAIEKMAEYRAVKSQKGPIGRSRKKLKAMEAEYRKARRIIGRSSILKMTLLLISYMLGSMLVILYVPVLPAPYSLPPFTVSGEGGEYIMSAILYFIAYIILFLSMRDTFL